MVELILIALLADGHVLLEDYPGSGKTTLAKTLGEAILDDLPHDEIPPFRRIQFTPDLLPSDITGVLVFDADTSAFSFRRGPIFAYVVLGDEVNRTSPKVQSAMLEAMAEKQVTVDNVSYPLDELFFVLATQNPLDLAGTYPLPVAQLDRFLFKVRMDYIDREAGAGRARHPPRAPRPRPAPTCPGCTGPRSCQRARRSRRGYTSGRTVLSCLVDIARAIRADPRVAQGISTRSLVMAVPALKARALARGRSFVSSEDVEALAPPIFGHRISLAAGGVDPLAVVETSLREPLEALSRSTLSRG